MKGSKLLAEAQLDIKIERGLKILQFAAQYNLRKAFLRNCTLNPHPDPTATPKVKAQQAQQHSTTADILAELNAEISQWNEGEKEHIEKREASKISVGDALSRSHSSSSSHSDHDSQQEGQQISLEELSNYQSQATRKRLKSIREEPDEANSLNNSKSKVIKVPKSSRSQVIHFQDLESVQEHNDSSVKSAKSNHLKVPQGNKTTKEPQSSGFKKKNTHQHSLSSGIVSLNQSDFPNVVLSNNKPTKKDVGLQSSFKKTNNNIDSSLNSLNQHSFLDKSISRIASHSSQLKEEPNSSTITAFSLMRELSSSFQDGENMKMLLKLQNCQLEQNYLEKRIVNRLQKGYKEVNSIFNITWQSLKMPRMQQGFQRPNYANLIE